MRCIGCGSRAVLEQTDRTAQGYRRFRCRDYGKQFNERSESLLNRTQYQRNRVNGNSSGLSLGFVHFHGL
jgi:transposase-like protein